MHPAIESLSHTPPEGSTGSRAFAANCGVGGEISAEARHHNVRSSAVKVSSDEHGA